MNMWQMHCICGNLGAIQVEVLSYDTFTAMIADKGGFRLTLLRLGCDPWLLSIVAVLVGFTNVVNDLFSYVLRLESI